MKDLRKYLALFLSWTLCFALGHFAVTHYVHAQTPSYTIDPCANPGTAKSSAFANITTATTTQLVALTAGKQIFVCGWNADFTSTTASTLLFEYGTGASCGTGTTVLTSTKSDSTAVNAYKFFGGGLMTVFSAPAGNALCAVSTVGTGPAIAVDVTYVQQ